MLDSNLKIGVVALSAPCERTRFDKGLSALKTAWPQVEVALDPCAEYGTNSFLFSSASSLDRARALQHFLKDSSIGCVLSARGAYGVMEVLPHIPPEILRARAKPIVGFSDTTALLVAAYQASGAPVIHGPALESGFSKASSDPAAQQSCEELLSLLKGTWRGWQGTLQRMDTNSAQEIIGPLHGGNLSMLAALAGTQWQPRFRNHILFIEEIGERPFRIHRMLLQLKMSGAFDGMLGVVIGHMLDCVHPKGLGPTVEDVMKDIFLPLSVPVFSGVPAGHAVRNTPLPFGVSLRVSEQGIAVL